MNAIDQRLNALGVELPTPAAPLANYVPAVILGTQLIISGQLCLDASGKLGDAHRGKLGETVSLEAGQAAARLCSINVLAQAKAALGGVSGGSSGAPASAASSMRCRPLHPCRR